MTPNSHRILIVDDNRDIHGDFRKILTCSPSSSKGGDIADLEADLFDEKPQASAARPDYELHSAYQGQEGYQKVLESMQTGNRYALAFVDMRMPPGWDGVQTIQKIWEADPEVQVVICTAYSDYSWEAILEKLGVHDRFLILKKPFDTIEVCQLARALTEKWHLARHAHLKLNQLKSMVDERTHELQETNRRLSEEVNERRCAEISLKESMTHYQTSFELAAVGKAHIDLTSKRFIKVNCKLCDLTGYSTSELLVMSPEQLGHSDDRTANDAQFEKMIRGEGECFSEQRYVRKDGRAIWVSVTSAVARAVDGNPAYLMAVIQDVTDRKLAEEQLRHDAMHDTLTGLPNRALLTHQITACIGRYKRDERRLFAVLFLDLDRFKVVNDSLGHLVGDKLLIGVARRLGDISRHPDTLAGPSTRGQVVRLGGDEFVLLLDDLETPDQAVRIAERMRLALREPFIIDGHELQAQTSIGIAVARPDYQTAEEILRDADTALYRAKTNRGSLSIFDQSMHQSVVERWNLECSLPRAIEHGDLFLHYQPVVDLHSGRVAEVEALVRWNHPQRGLLSPAVFIPLAEDTGQIIHLGEWILRTACTQAAEWSAMGLPIPIAVNVSSRQLRQPDFLETVKNALRETALAPAMLRLEITEGSLVENTDTVAETIRQLLMMGVEFHLDDFGTGYSSLSYLHRFPVSVLKIDRSFVASMHNDATSRSIVQVITTLGKTLGVTIIAEGVESQKQVAELRGLGCQLAQGYHFARPLPAMEATQYLLQNAMEQPAPPLPTFPASLSQGATLAKNHA